MEKATKQVVLNFDRMTPAGLNPLAKKFERYRLKVTDIAANNKGRRESGFLVKDATFVFESGQKLLVRVKADGTVFQVKLNNRVVPIKHVDNMDRAVIELVDHVQGNEKRYIAAKNQRLKKQKVKIDQPNVRTTRKERLEQAESRTAELTAERDELQKKLTDIKKTSTDKDKRLGELQAEFQTLSERGADLEKELNELKKEAA